MADQDFRAMSLPVCQLSLPGLWPFWLDGWHCSTIYSVIVFHMYQEMTRLGKNKRYRQ